MSEAKEEFPNLKFGENFVDIKFKHHQIASEDEVNFHRWVTQQRVSQRIGREVSLDEIAVSPDVGESYEVTVGFRVKENTGNPYLLLVRIHNQDQTVLPGLLNWLEQHQETENLEDFQKNLLGRAVGGLRRIIDPQERVR